MAVTFNDLVDQWWNEHAKPHLEERTLILYRGKLDNHVLDTIGTVELVDLTSARLKRFLNDLREDTSPRGANIAQTVISSACQYGVMAGLLEYNPARGIPRFKETRRSIRIYEPEEVQAIADAMPTARDRAIVIVAAYTGLRRSELFALHWSDISTRELRVERALTPSRVYKAPKTNRQRRVPILKHVRDSIADVPRRSNIVFAQDNGDHIFESNWNRRVWKKAVTAAGFPDATLTSYATRSPAT